MNSMHNENFVTIVNSELDTEESFKPTDGAIGPATIFPNLTTNKGILLFQNILQDLTEEIDIIAVILIILSLLIAIVGILIICFHCCLWKKSKKLPKRSYDAVSWLEYKLDRSTLNKNDRSRCSFSSSLTSSMEKNGHFHYHNCHLCNTQQHKYINEKHKRMSTFLWNKSAAISSPNHHLHKSSESLSTSGLNLSSKRSPCNLGFDYLICHHNDNNNNNCLNKDDRYLPCDLNIQELNDNKPMNFFFTNRQFTQMPSNSMKQKCKISSVNAEMNGQKCPEIKKRENRFVIGKNKEKKLKRSLFSGKSRNGKKKQYYPSKNAICDTEPFFTSSISSSRSNRTISEYMNASANLTRDYEIQTAEMNLTDSDDGMEKGIFHGSEISKMTSRQISKRIKQKNRLEYANQVYLGNDLVGNRVATTYKSFARNPLRMEMHCDKNASSPCRIYSRFSSAIDNWNNENNSKMQQSSSSEHHSSTFPRPSLVDGN